MAVALESIVKQLEDSGIVSPGKLKEFIPPQASPKDAQELMRELVRSQHLTKFQAQEVYQGRARSLLLGNYTILDKIGAGGMGQVFKAEHRRMKRVVAVKMLPKNVTKDAAAVARFQREVEAAAKLRHPNIVAADDADEAAGVHFLVMEYVEGSDLSALVKKNGPFPVAKAVNLILQAARGLEFAHKKGVIHRDIKPANLLLDSEGTVKILDMGLARIDSDDGPAQAELTGTGTVMGTVDYMAPEQALSTKTADARADIYSLGCSLYYLIAGKATYGGETLMAKLLAHRESPIPSLRDAQPDVPEQLVTIFQKMVAKKVDDRYQTMTAVVADLEACHAERGQDSGVRGQAAETDSGLLTFLKDIPAVTTHKPTPTKKTKPASAPLAPPHLRNAARGEGPGVRGFASKKKLVLGAVGAAALGVAILAGIIFKLQTKDGTLVVEINQPDAVVQVLDEQGQIEITQPGGSGKLSISVDPGKHRLRVEKSGFQFFTQDFTLESGGQASIKATLVPTAILADQPNKPWNTPAFQQWVKATQALPAEKQIEALSKKLMELNPGFDGKVTDISGKGPPTVELGVVKEIAFSGIDVTDISPVRALKGLRALGCTGSGPRKSRLSDLSPLQGLPLTKLFCSISEVSNLAPLKGMPLKVLYCHASRVFDLSPIQGMPLTDLNISSTLVTDLSPLKGMQLTSINCGASNVTDISVLRGMPLNVVYALPRNVSDPSPLADCKSLTTVNLRQTKVTAASVAALQKALPNCKIEWDAPTTPLPQQPASVAPTPPLAAPPIAVAPFNAVQAKAHQAAWAKHLGTQVETTNSVGAKMILIPPGEFLMGSSDEQIAQALKIAEGEREADVLKKRIQTAERPQHRVVITRPFVMGATEVTIGQFKQFAAAADYETEAERTPLVDGKRPATYRAPGYTVTDDTPAKSLSWNDALAYCQWLSAQENATYRLPTEAEWEYACRAGTTTQYWFGDDPAALAQHAETANPFGLFNVAGNTYEWCQDFWDDKSYDRGPTVDPQGLATGTRKVIRGGASGRVALSRSAYRHESRPSSFDGGTARPISFSRCRESGVVCGVGKRNRGATRRFLGGRRSGAS